MIKQLTDYFASTDNKISIDLGEITLTKTIGQGGNGLVYEADLYGTKLAVKFLVSEASGNTKKNKELRFKAEYFNVIMLPLFNGIVKYVDFETIRVNLDSTEIELPMIIMQRYEGALNLWRKEVTVKRFENLLAFLLKAVSFIHKNGIIHRDIKPENILVNGDNLVLTDFGIASYNPEIFFVRATTKKGERIGNRLFSAPEQESGNVEANETMDVYAIGQVLQWFVTGDTHRGTGRKKISSIFPELEKYDYMIEKCLMNDPKRRFLNIKEIETFLQKEPKIDPYEEFRIFNRALRSSYPRNDRGIVHSDSPERIDKLFQSLASASVDLAENLHNTSHRGDYDFKLKRIEKTRWKLDSIEYDIKEIWVHYDSSIYNDFVLVHYNADQPFIFEGNKRMYDIIVDGKYQISYTEKENGYAEINGDIVKLSDHEVTYTDREGEEGYFFISTRDHCAHYHENDRHIRNFIQHHLDSETTPTIEEIQKLNHQIRKNLPYEVSIRR